MNIAIIATADDKVRAVDFIDEGDLLAQVSQDQAPVVILPILNLLPDQVTMIKSVVQEHIYSEQPRFINQLVMIIEEVHDLHN